MNESLRTVVLTHPNTGHRVVLREDPEIVSLADAGLGDGGILSWEGQVRQYPVTGPAGISYFAGHVGGGLPPVNCLLLRDMDSTLLGIANHYPVDYPPYERAGNVLILIHPDHRHQGLGTDLLRAVNARWELNPDQQRYSRAGLDMVHAFLISSGYEEVPR